MAMDGGLTDMFSDICRLCGNQQPDNFNIFESEGKNKRIQNKIKLKIDINITQDDPLPKVVCRVCYEQLEVFIHFQEKCHETQETLMNIFLSVVQSCMSDSGAVEEKAPNVVLHFVDGSSERQDDKLVTTMTEVPVVFETAEKTQHGSALLNFLAIEGRSEFGDFGQWYSYTAAVPVQPTRSDTSVMQRESVPPSRPAMTPMSSVTYVVIREEEEEGLLVPDMLVLLGENPTNKVPIPRLTKCNRSDQPACKTVPPSDAATVANITTRAKTTRCRKTRHRLRVDAVEEKVPNVVFHFVDANSVGHDDERVATIMEVPVVSKTAEKTQHRSALLNVLTTEGQSELGDLSQLDSYSAAVSVQPSPSDTSVEQRESVRLTPPAMTPTSSVTYLVIRNEAVEGLFVPHTPVPVGENPANKVPIPRLATSNLSDQSACVTVPPCDAATVTNNPYKAKTTQYRKIMPRLTGLQMEKGYSGGEEEVTNNFLDCSLKPVGIQQDLKGEAQLQNVNKSPKQIFFISNKSRASYIKRRARWRKGANPESDQYVNKRKVECETMVALYIDKVSDTQYRCKLCSQVFRWNCKCEEHVRRHTGEKPIKCDICGKGFILNYCLRVHLRVHQNIRFSCDLCDKSFKCKSHLKDHLKCHQSESRYVCDVCGYQCKTSYSFNCHVRSKHRKQQQYICDICGKVFTNARANHLHIKRHHAQLQGLMSCSICNKNFCSKYELRNHMAYHNAVSPYSCEPCSMFFKTKRSLGSHTRWIHPTTTHRIPEKVISDGTSPNAEEGVAAWHKAVGITVYKADVSDTVDDADMEECIDSIRIEHKALRTYQQKPKSQAVFIKEDLLKF